MRNRFREDGSGYAAACHRHFVTRIAIESGTLHFPRVPLFHLKRTSKVTLPTLLALLLCGMAGIGVISSGLMVSQILGLDSLFDFITDLNASIMEHLDWPSIREMSGFLTLYQILFGGFFIGAGTGYFFFCRDRDKPSAT